MTEYPDHLAAARKLLDQQGEINTLTERAKSAEAERDRLKARGEFLREMLNLLSVSYVPTGQVLRWLDRPEPPSAALLAQPEFPLPIRPDGTHFYVSTYCAHGDHAACRRTCKTCGTDCLCRGCQHDEPIPVGTSAATANEAGPSVGADATGVRLWDEGSSGCGFPPAQARKASPAVQRQAAERFGFPLRTPATPAQTIADKAVTSGNALDKAEAAAPTEFRWRMYGAGGDEWSRWHSLTGTCKACCCRGPEECSPPDCTDREHQEPGEPIEAFDCVHNRMCQGCWRDEYDEPEGKVEYR